MQGVRKEEQAEWEGRGIEGLKLEIFDQKELRAPWDGLRSAGPHGAGAAGLGLNTRQGEQCSRGPGFRSWLCPGLSVWP